MEGVRQTASDAMAEGDNVLRGTDGLGWRKITDHSLVEQTKGTAEVKKK